MKKPPLILASASPRRAELLRQLGAPFSIAATGIPEVEGSHLSAVETVRVNAFRKARAAAKLHPAAIVLGVDTVVALDVKLFAKPSSLREAGQFLSELQGKTHRVVTGVCLLRLERRQVRIFCEETAVTFRPLTRAQIRRYHALVNPLDKAGGYGIQEQGEMLVESIDGSFANVMGLPVERLAAELRAFGVRVASLSKHRKTKKHHAQILARR